MDDLVDIPCQAGDSHRQEQQQQQQQPQQLFTDIRNRWYTNEEVASILTNFKPEWQTNELQVRPKSGSVLLYSREKVRYRQDGYCWKKRKNGRTTREDHMKLKVQGIECIYGCYVHSAILPTFHRRCYWLLENPDIVLVHYLNQPADDQNEMILTFNSDALEADTRRAWTNKEIIDEIGSVFGGISQIHHTLSLNFPVATSTRAQVCDSRQVDGEANEHLREKARDLAGASQQQHQVLQVHDPMGSEDDIGLEKQIVSLDTNGFSDGEQITRSNSVLNYRSPKAVSLDGSDLSTTSQQHPNNYQPSDDTSPLIGAYASAHQQYCDQKHGGSLQNQDSSNINNSENDLLLLKFTEASNSSEQRFEQSQIYKSSSMLSLPSELTNILTDSYPSEARAFNMMGSVNHQQRSGSVAAAACHVSNFTNNSQQEHEYLAATIASEKVEPQAVAAHSSLLPILDYVPNWSPHVGGTKVLIIGNWANFLMSGAPSEHQQQPALFAASHGASDSARRPPPPPPPPPQQQQHQQHQQQQEAGFYALFDDIMVPATLIQSNVLRCHAPQHEPGFLALRVIYKNMIISEQVSFEMKLILSPKTECISASSSFADNSNTQLLRNMTAPMSKTDKTCRQDMSTSLYQLVSD